MKIAVDIDDTLNTIERAKYAGDYFQENALPFCVTDPDANAFVRVANWSEDDVIKFIHAGGYKAFRDALPREGAREVLARWKQQGHTVLILTARLKSWFQDPFALSHDWLTKYGFPFSELVADVEEKGKYCREHHVDVLIDDNLTQLRSARENGVVPVLAVRAATEGAKEEFPFRGETWEEIERAVDLIAQGKGKA